MFSSLSASSPSSTSSSLMLWTIPMRTSTCVFLRSRRCGPWAGTRPYNGEAHWLRGTVRKEDMKLLKDTRVLTERGSRWASTMAGHVVPGMRTAHANSSAMLGPESRGLLTRSAREDGEDAWMRSGATRAEGAGTRERDEDADPV